MKKLITISFLILLVAVSVNAQVEKVMKAVDPPKSWLHDANLSASDTIGAGDSTWTYQISPNKGEALYYDVYMDIDSVGGTGGIANLVPVLLQGRRLETDPWTTITTVNYAVTADTIFKYSQVSTAQFYTDYRISITAANDAVSVLISRLIFRFWR